MKKTFLLMFVLLVLAGCTNKTIKQNNPGEVVKSYVEKNHPSASILSQKLEKNFYLALIESNNIVSLIILEDVNGEYKYFGETSYDSNKEKYGSYVFVVVK